MVTGSSRLALRSRQAVAATHPVIAKVSLLPENAPTDVEERLALVVRELTRFVVEHEAQNRTMLRLSLDPATPREHSTLQRRFHRPRARSQIRHR